MPTLRERALRLLARREHSRAELAGKLRRYAAPEEDLEILLDDLSRRKLLSDERYAESRTHALSRKYGAARIAHELRAKGRQGARRAGIWGRARDRGRASARNLAQKVPGRAQDPRGAGQADAFSPVARVFLRRDSRRRRRPRRGLNSPRIRATPIHAGFRG